MLKYKITVLAVGTLFSALANAQVAAPDAQLDALARKSEERLAHDGNIKNPMGSERVVFKGFEFIGLSEEQQASIKPVYESSIGKKLMLYQINELLMAAQNILQSRGNSLIFTLLPQDAGQSLKVKSVPVQYTGPVLKNSGGLSSSFATKTLNYGVKPGQLNSAQLERNVEVLIETPGAHVQYGMSPGAKTGDTELDVVLQKTPVFWGSVEEANTGVKETGMWQTFANLNTANLLGLGDQTGLTVMGASNSRFANFTGDLPVGHSGLRAGVEASYFGYGFKDEAANKYDGTATSYGLYASYPLVRTQSAKSSIRLELQRKSSKGDFTPSGNSAFSLSDTTETVANVSLYGAKSFGQNDSMSYNLTVTSGNVSQNVQAAKNQDKDGPNQMGSFTKINASTVWTHNVAKNDTAQLSLAGQWASKNLTGGEKLYLGGMGNFSGYKNQTVGLDDALTAKLQYNWVSNRVTVSPFVEVAYGKMNKTNYLTINSTGVLDSAKGNSVTMADAGVSLKATLAKNLVLAGSVAVRLRDAPSPYGVKTDSGSVRGFVQLSYAF